MPRIFVILFRHVTLLFDLQTQTSMAELQGYFLKHKDDPTAAVNNASQFRHNLCTDMSSSLDSNANCKSDKGSDQGDKELDGARRVPQSISHRRRRALTALEMDKMSFNPQYDWEKDIYTGTK